MAGPKAGKTVKKSGAKPAAAKAGGKKAGGTVTITHGTASITFEARLALDPRAGTLTPEQVLRTPKPPLGVGLVCAKTATAIDNARKAGKSFVLPGGLTAEELREAGEKADDIDLVIRDVEVLLAKLKQGNLLFDATAWDKLRVVNDQVKTQGKRDPELLVIFADLIDYLAKGPRSPKNEKPEGGEK